MRPLSSQHLMAHAHPEHAAAKSRHCRSLTRLWRTWPQRTPRARGSLIIPPRSTRPRPCGRISHLTRRWRVRPQCTPCVRGSLITLRLIAAPPCVPISRITHPRCMLRQCTSCARTLRITRLPRTWVTCAWVLSTRAARTRGAPMSGECVWGAAELMSAEAVRGARPKYSNDPPQPPPGSRPMTRSSRRHPCAGGPRSWSSRGAVLIVPIETSVQRPLAPLSRVRDSGATSMRQKDRGSASMA